MRLLHARESKFQEFFEANVPPYAILSHTWGPVNTEVSYQDMLYVVNAARRSQHSDDEIGEIEARPGFKKIMECRRRAIDDGLQWVWVDTCCIDKSSSAELTEAINTMHRWYKKSAVCYAYLADLPDGYGKSSNPKPLSTWQMEAFQNSRWFTRGWTLQELIAPRSLWFFDSGWKYFGRRSAPEESEPSLIQIVSEITGIPQRYLEDGDVQHASIAQKMSWASNRTTTRTEDMAYCLLGIFNVNIPLLYGEGDQAFMRLQEEILKSSSDHSILAWSRSPITIQDRSSIEDASEVPIQRRKGLESIFATSPQCFARSADLRPFEQRALSEHSMTNLGLRIELPLCPINGGVVALLNCQWGNRLDGQLGLNIARVTTSTIKWQQSVGRTKEVVARDNSLEFYGVGRMDAESLIFVPFNPDEDSHPTTSATLYCPRRSATIYPLITSLEDRTHPKVLLLNLFSKLGYKVTKALPEYKWDLLTDSSTATTAQCHIQFGNASEPGAVLLQSQSAGTAPFAVLISFGSPPVDLASLIFRSLSVVPMYGFESIDKMQPLIDFEKVYNDTCQSIRQHHGIIGLEISDNSVILPQRNPSVGSRKLTLSDGTSLSGHVRLAERLGQKVCMLDVCAARNEALQSTTLTDGKSTKAFPTSESRSKDDPKQNKRRGWKR